MTPIDDDDKPGAAGKGERPADHNLTQELSVSQVLDQRDDSQVTSVPGGHESTQELSDSQVLDQRDDQPPPLPGGKRRGGDRSTPAPTLPPTFDALASSASGKMAGRMGLGGLLRSGLAAPRRFPGLCLSIYLVQIAMSLAAAGLMAMLLSRAFAHRPMFDRAMQGDIAALLTSLRGQPGLLTALVTIGLAAVVLYWLVSWFLTAGLIAVLLDPPARRREVARWFGAGGAVNFFPYLFLGLWSLVPYAAVIVVAGLGLGHFGPRLRDALSWGEVAIDLVGALGPALVLYWLVGTAVDYARVDLVRHPGMSSARALLRGYRTIARHRIALVHTLLYGVVFALASAAYMTVVADGALMSLLALVILRQVLALVRFVAHVAVIGGQVELACARVAPPLGRRRGMSAL